MPVSTQFVVACHDHGVRQRCHSADHLRISIETLWRGKASPDDSTHGSERNPKPGSAISIADQSTSGKSVMKSRSAFSGVAGVARATGRAIGEGSGLAGAVGGVCRAAGACGAGCGCRGAGCGGVCDFGGAACGRCAAVGGAGCRTAGWAGGEFGAGGAGACWAGC